jgi:eukaryotic-like serine/threonine-protein kinase
LSDILSRISAALADRYRIERELGSGGMATVYLAEDLKHHRKVAVKVLRPELAATLGSDRFLREVETAAQFQHPHILPLLDSGEAGGFLYYVMPYVEGENLRTRLTRRGELPIHDAVKILVEVCDALAYAHAHGVVHRDIKPDNVLLSGRHALVADFGVAKALSEATGRQRFTTAGVALGTPAYMAPEQAAAEPDIDHRADIYALGALGYELISGGPPFTGRTSQEVLAAHVTQPPEPLCGRRSACPPGLESVIMKCLEKRRADRWQTADELLAELEQLATPSGGTTPTQTRPTLAVGGPRPKAFRLGGLAAALLVLGGIGVVLASRTTRDLPALGKRSAITLDPGLEMTPAISPDGKTVAYSRMTPTESRLLVRQLGGGEPVTVARMAGLNAAMPAWSPDGTRLLYRSLRGLEVIPALGGVSRLLATQPPATRSGWGSWAPDGEQIVYASGDTLYIRRLAEDAPRVLLTVGQPHSPVWSPDGQWIAYTSGNREYAPFANIAPSSIWMVRAAGGTPLRITEDRPLHASPAWLPDSRGLLYVSDQDGGRDVYFVGLSRSGTPQRKAVRLTTGLNPHTISLSADGRRLIYSTHTETANVFAVPLQAGRSVSLRAGKPITGGSQVIEGFSVAPDGRWLVFDSNRNGNQDIWRMPLDGSSPAEPLSALPEDEFQPAYSADGKYVAFHVTQSGAIRDLYVIPSIGGRPERVAAPTRNNLAPRLAPDGNAMLYICPPPGGGSAVCALRRGGSGAGWGRPRPLFTLPGALHDWSPDGRWIVYGPQANQVSRAAPDGTGSRVLATLPGGFIGFWSRWAQDSRVIYVSGVAADGRAVVYAVPAEGGTAREVAHSEGPTYQTYRFGFDVHGGTLYLSVADPQSDIWVTEVGPK